MSPKSNSEEKSSNRYNIRVLDRGCRILELMSDGRRYTLQELSEELGLSMSTTFRLLSTLSEHQFVKRDDETNKYSLWLACLALAKGFNESDGLRQVAMPELEMLRDEVKETVHLSILDHMEIVYIEKLECLHAIGLMSSRVGGRSPAHCTGVGKALLAFFDPEKLKKHFQEHGLRRYTDTTITSLDKLFQELEMIREKGYALDVGEHETEVRCVAAPLFNIKGEAVAGISISGPVARMEPLEEQSYLIQKVKETARSISQKLGYSSS